jgi:hypothetical protein
LRSETGKSTDIASPGSEPNPGERRSFRESEKEVEYFHFEFFVCSLFRMNGGLEMLLVYIQRRVLAPTL